MNWNPNKFILPSLYTALQTEDDVKAEVATEAWEESSVAYQKYLAEIEWPDWLKTFIFGEIHTGVNSSDKLHDAELAEFWHSERKLIMVLSTKDCAWDGRKAVVVIEYKLASPVEIDEPERKTEPKNRKKFFLYDQFSDMGGGIYRQYIMFNSMNVQIDFSHLKITRFEL